MSGEVFSFAWGKPGKPSLSDAREVLRLQKEHKANVEAGRAQDRSLAARAANISEFMQKPLLNIPEPTYPGPLGVTSLATKAINSLSTPENLAMGALTAAAPYTAPAVGAYYGGESLIGAAESAMEGNYGEAAIKGGLGAALAIPSIGSIARRPVRPSPTMSGAPSPPMEPSIIPEPLRDPNLNLNRLADALEAGNVSPEVARSIIRTGALPEPPPPGPGMFDPLQSRPQVKPEIVSPQHPGILQPEVPGQFRHTLPPPEFTPETITPEAITPEGPVLPPDASKRLQPSPVETPPPVDIPEEAIMEDIVQTRRPKITEPEPPKVEAPKGEYEDFLRERLEKPTTKEEVEPEPEFKISDKRIQEEEPFVTAPSRLQKTVSNIREETIKERIPKVEEPPLTESEKKVPDWMKSNVDAAYERLDKSGVADKVEELAARRLTAGQIAKQLGIEKSDVLSVRNKRGIPSMDFTSEFESWIKSKEPSVSIPEPAPIQKMELPEGVTFRKNVEGLDYYDVDIPGGKPTMIGVGPEDDLAAKVKETRSKFEGKIPEDMKVEGGSSRTKADFLDDAIKELDSRKASDEEYKSLFSTATKDKLKRGETWRDKAIKYRDYKRQLETPEIEAPPFKERTAEPPKVEISEEIDSPRTIAVRELNELRDSRPRPKDKLFGKKGPTPEQEKAYNAQVNEWNRKYRMAKNKLDEAVAAEQKAKPTEIKPTEPIKSPQLKEEFKGKTPEELYDVKEVKGNFILKDKATGKTVTVTKSKESAWEAAKKRIKEFGSGETGAIPIPPKQKVGSTKKTGTRDQFVDDMVNRGMDRDQAERNADALFGKGQTTTPPIRAASISLDPNIRSAAAQADDAVKRGTLRKVYDFVGTSIETQIRRTGPAGEQIADKLSRARLRGDSYAGQWGRKASEAIKPLSDKQFDEFVTVLDEGKTSSNPAVNRAANLYKQIDDEVVAKAQSAGLGLKDSRTGNIVPFTGRANYFPHIYPKEFFDKLTKNKGFRDQIIDQMMKKGLTRSQAERVLKQSRQHGERLISAQHGRDPFEVPGWMRDKKVLIRHLDDMGRRIARAEELGAGDIGDPKSVLSGLVEKTNDPGHVNTLLKRVLNREEPHGKEFTEFARRVTNAESLLHLSHFAISNLAQTAMIPIRSNFRATAKAAWRAATSAKKFYNNALDDGSIVEVTHRQLLDEMGGRGLAGKLYGFGASEKLQRMFSSGVGRADAELTFKALKKNPNSTRLRKHLKELLIENPDDVLKQSALTEDQVHMAGSRLAEITQGLAGPQDLPPAWTAHPLMNLIFLYKRFAFRGTKLIADAVRERPVANTLKALALLPIAGEVTGDIKAGISGAVQGDIGKEVEARSERLPVTGNKAIDRMLANYMQAWSLGIVGDILESAYRGQASGLLQFAAGPVISDVAETGSGLAQVIKKKPNPKPLLKKATQSVPFVGTGLRKKLFPTRRSSGRLDPQVESPAF